MCRLQGVGMVLPIEASMASRAHFDLVLSLTMGGITLLYIGFGLVRANPGLVKVDRGSCAAKCLGADASSILALG